MDELRPDRSPAGRRARLRRELKWVGWAVLALLVLGFGAGWLVSRANGPLAARAVLGDRVVQESEDGTPADGADAAPTFGGTTADPVCGVHDQPVAAEVQLATLVAGGVVYQYDPSAVTADGVGALAELAAEYRSHVLVAPNPRLAAPIVATASHHRMELDTVNIRLLRAFATGYGVRRTPPETCPT